jgi:hypothetical protein
MEKVTLPPGNGTVMPENESTNDDGTVDDV